MQYVTVTFFFSSVRQLGRLIGICCTDLVKDTIFNLLNQLNHTPHPSQRKFPAPRHALTLLLAGVHFPPSRRVFTFHPLLRSVTSFLLALTLSFTVVLMDANGVACVGGREGADIYASD